MYDIYCNYTSCIRSQNLDAIAEAIKQLLEQEESCQRLSQLSHLSMDSKQLRSSAIWQRSRLWVVSLFVGEGGWTIIKTWPNEWLCQRNTGENRPRLSILARQLGCDAFHYRVVRDFCGILLEADAIGRLFVTGWNDNEGVYDIEETHRFYEEQIDKPDEPQFSFIKVCESIQAAMRVNDDPEIARKEAEYHRLIQEKNLDPDSHFEALRVLEPVALQGGAERVDTALGEVLDPSRSCWNLNDLLYEAYTEPRKLEERGVKLLYFQPPDTYNPTPPKYEVPAKYWEENDGEDF